MLLCELFQNKTLSPEFYAWFGDSKAVNADGSPMILYHGTSKDQDFKHFNIPKSGTWFATTPKGASDYAVENDSQNLVYDHGTGKFIHKHTASRVIPVYLKINNPKVYEGYPQEEVGTTQNYKKASGILFDKLRAEGHDSIIITHQGKPMVVALLVNDPSRIKSAISNKDYTHKKNIHEKASPASAIVKAAVLKNPKFKQWFGKSKIVDHHGLPLVVYHGTASAFEAFEVASIGKVFSDDKHGFFFTNNTGEDMASGYAKNAAIKYKNDNFDDVEYHGANVIPAFVKIENPYTWEDYMFAYDYDQPTDEKDYERKISYIMDGMSMIGWFDENKYAIVQQALDEGHDGIFLFDPTTDITFGKGNPTPENIVVAFRPDQIKSVFAKEFAPTDKLSEATDDWDLGGCWITNRGRVEDCDHKNDRHHSHIALDDFIDFIDPNEENEYDDYCRNAAVDMAYDEGWIRISTRGHRDFTVEWRSEPTAEAKQSIVKTVLSYKQQHFDNYELEVKGTFRQYNNFDNFFRDLRKSLRSGVNEKNLYESMNQPKYLYHATKQSNVDSIMQNGLQTKYYGAVHGSMDIHPPLPAIYLSRKPASDNLNSNMWTEPAMVLKIDFAQLDTDQMWPDDFIYDAFAKEEILTTPNSVMKALGVDKATAVDIFEQLTNASDEQLPELLKPFWFWYLTHRKGGEVAYTADIPPTAIVGQRPHPFNSQLTESIEIVHDRFRNESDDDYVYHITLEPLAQRIMQQGFMPNRRPTMTNYSGYSKGKVFFTERSGVSFWEERVEQHAENNMDDPPPVAVLRVSKEEIGSLLQPDPVGTRDSHASCYFITEPFKPTN